MASTSSNTRRPARTQAHRAYWKRLPNPYELEYELWTPVGWRRTSHMLLEYTTLPISEEEFQRLSAEFLAGQHPHGSVEVDEMLRRWPH